MNNLVGTAGSAALKMKLDAILNKKLAEAHDRFLPAGEHIRNWGYTVDAEGTVPYAP
jgi:hypothetical protein